MNDEPANNQHSGETTGDRLTADTDSDSQSGQDSETEPDGGRTVSPNPTTHTVRLELADEPGQLLAALRPIADNGGNLLSIYHERGNMTPRGRIPVEVDFECPPEAFDGIIEAFRGEGVNVIQAGTEEYGEEVVLVLVGHLIDTDLSDSLQRIEESVAASVEDVSLSGARGTDEQSSARLRLAAKAGEASEVLRVVQELASEKELDVIEPLMEVDP